MEGGGNGGRADGDGGRADGRRLAGGFGGGGQAHLSRRRSRVPGSAQASEAVRGGGASEDRSGAGAGRPNTQRCRASALDIRLKLVCLSDLGLDIEPEYLAPMS
jgi:hypothetical protein